jgi:ABC-type multidrug transport system fused ATPase/permease subunit
MNYCGRPSTEDKALWRSFIFLTYLNDLFAKGSNGDLYEEDLGGISSQDRSGLLHQRFAVHFEADMKMPMSPKSLWLVFFRATGLVKLTTAFLLYGISTAVQFGPVLILTHLVNHFSNMEPLSNSAWWTLITLLFVFPMVSSVTAAHSVSIMAHVGCQVRSIIIGALYRKVLTISTSRRQSTTTGRILTMFSADTNQIKGFISYMNNIAVAPLQFGISLYLMYQQVGVAAFVGLAYQVVSIPLQVAIIKAATKMKQSKMQYADKRLKLLNEVLNGIRVIKFNAWEDAFAKKIAEIRSTEIRILKVLGYLVQSTFGVMMLGAPQIISVLIFWTYTAQGNQLDAAKVFTIMALVGLMSTPFIMLPYGLQMYNTASVSVKRILDFLCEEDMSTTVTIDVPEDAKVAVEFVNASLSWLPDTNTKDSRDNESRPQAMNAMYDKLSTTEHGYTEGSDTDSNQSECILQNITVQIKKGQLVAIVGPVGSGKSSILAALLGELHLREGGQVRIADCCSAQIAYSEQRPWILNASIKENILFGNAYDVAKLDRALHVTALHEDLKMFPNGLDTEIGERGINLSGGQKARISLARAVYSDAELYLLDDPLSAVDAHVGEHIFQQCIVEQLAGKTRLLVTHQSRVLPRCDYVVVLGGQGQMIVAGSYAEVVNSGINVDEYSVDQDKATDHNKRQSVPTKEDRPEHLMSKVGQAVPGSGREVLGKSDSTTKGLIIPEERTTGKLSRAVVVEYILFGGAVAFAAVLGLQLISQGLNIKANIWLTNWGKSEHHIQRWLRGYVILQLTAVGFMTAARMVLLHWRTTASHRAHELLLNKVLHFPVSFFDITPIGRVINRFSQDIAVLDEELPQGMNQLIGYGSSVLGAIGGITVATKGTFLILLLPLMSLYSRFQMYFAASNNSLTRIEAISRSPIYADFSQTMSGTTTIRAFGQQARFIAHMEDLVNANTIPAVLQQIAAQWLSIRLDFVGALIMLFLGVLAAGLQGSSFIPPGYLGLSLAYAITMTGLLKLLVRGLTQVEANFNSVDRVLHYIHNVHVETSTVITARHGHSGHNNSCDGEVTDWPTHGVVEFQNVGMGYRDGELVLKDVSFKVNSKEKIGIVGRTGYVTP